MEFQAAGSTLFFHPDDLTLSDVIDGFSLIQESMSERPLVCVAQSIE